MKQATFWGQVFLNLHVHLCLIWLPEVGSVLLCKVLTQIIAIILKCWKPTDAALIQSLLEEMEIY